MNERSAASKSPAWFKVVAAIALLWNLLGCLAFAADLSLSPDDVANLSAREQALYAARPAWSVIATAFAVFAGALGCVGLLLSRKWAYALLWLSLLGILVQDFGMFVLAGGARLAGPTAIGLQLVVLLVGIGLVLLARKGITRRWLT